MIMPEDIHDMLYGIIPDDIATMLLGNLNDGVFTPDQAKLYVKAQYNLRINGDTPLAVAQAIERFRARPYCLQCHDEGCPICYDRPASAPLRP